LHVIRKALDTLNLTFMATTDVEEKHYEDIINSKNSIRVYVEALSRQNVNYFQRIIFSKFCYQIGELTYMILQRVPIQL